MKTITTAHSHGLKTGDLVAIHTPDGRRWKRFICWIFRRDPPLVTKYVRVGDTSHTTFEVVE
jgi:hypothetical protein